MAIIAGVITSIVIITIRNWKRIIADFNEISELRERYNIFK